MSESGRERNSVWDDDAGVPRLVAGPTPPQGVEINHCPVRCDDHEQVLREAPSSIRGNNDRPPIQNSKVSGQAREGETIVTVHGLEGSVG